MRFFFITLWRWIETGFLQLCFVDCLRRFSKLIGTWSQIIFFQCTLFITCINWKLPMYFFSLLEWLISVQSIIFFVFISSFCKQTKNLYPPLSWGLQIYRRDKISLKKSFRCKNDEPSDSMPCCFVIANDVVEPLLTFSIPTSSVSIGLLSSTTSKPSLLLILTRLLTQIATCKLK